nr:conserved uncharacterized protein [uncultured bacterium]
MTTNAAPKTPAAEQAIASILAALEEMLATAHAQAAEALGYANEGNRNAAIGTIIDLENLLADAAALRGSALALHRRAA